MSDTVGRNNPCPCGSGKKYKDCHLNADSQDLLESARSYHTLDRQLLRKMTEFGKVRFGVEWLLSVYSLYPPGPVSGGPAVSPFAPWSLYHLSIQERSFVDWFIIECEKNISDSEMQWIESQRSAWISIWEILSVRNEVGVFVHDLFTGKRCFIHEKEGSLRLSLRQCVLARVVDHMKLSLFCGIHNVSLPREQAVEIAQDALPRLSGQLGITSMEALRVEGIDRWLISLWNNKVVSGRTSLN